MADGTRIMARSQMGAVGFEPVVCRSLPTWIYCRGTSADETMGPDQIGERMSFNLGEHEAKEVVQEYLSALQRPDWRACPFRTMKWSRGGPRSSSSAPSRTS